MKWNKGNKLVPKKVLAVLIYIIAVGMDMISAIKSYDDFLHTYGKMEFSKGIVGILICNGGHIIIFLALSILLIKYLIKGKL